jgi:hypothetical protein
VVGACVATGLVGCGSNSAIAGPGDASADVGSDATTDSSGLDAPAEVSEASEGGSTRSYLMASGGVQLVVGGPGIGLQITPANLADDAEVIEVHQEFYGVPWNEFQAGSPPPAAWTAQMDQIAGFAKTTTKPVFLSISMLSGGRDSLAARTVIQNGMVQAQNNWAAHCYDFASASDGAALKQAYLAYVGWMVD